MKDTAKHINSTGVLWFPCFCIILQSILYGFGDPISKAAYDAMPVLSLLSLRYLIALAVFLVFGWKRIWQGLKQCSWKDWLLPSVCIAGSYVLSNLALGMSAATSVAFLRSLSTVMTPLLALAVYRARYRWQHIPVQLLVVVGLYLLCGFGGLSGFGLGEILTLAAALLMAGSLVFGGHALEKVDPITLSTVQTAMSALFATICAFAFEDGWNLQTTTPKIWAIIVYLAVCCTLTGYLLQNIALKRIAARTVALLQCICPVLTAVFSFLMLGERLSAAGIIGSGIILICVVAETMMEEK